MPALRMTNVSPIAMIAMIATCSVITSRFEPVKKAGEITLKTIVITISATKARSRSRSIRQPRGVRSWSSNSCTKPVCT